MKFILKANNKEGKFRRLLNNYFEEIGGQYFSDGTFYLKISQEQLKDYADKAGVDYNYAFDYAHKHNLWMDDNNKY